MLRQASLRAANVALRTLASGSRFALIILLARFLDPAQIGLYGLFAATVGFSMLAIGGDYYTYSQRELMASPRERWSFVLQHQALATGLLYLLLLPPQWLIFGLDLLPATLVIWFFALLLVEHVAGEINRLLVAMHRPLVASWVLFLRLGAWVWVVLPILWLEPSARGLTTVFLAWLLGAMLSIAVGLRVVWRDAAPWQAHPIDWRWLGRGYKVGLLFLTASLCFKALTTADRYVVEHLVGPELLGVYVLYIGIAMALMTVLDPAIFSFLYPRIVNAWRQQDRPTYRRLMRELAWSTVGLSVLLALLIAALAPYVFDWIGRPIYGEHQPLLWLLLAASAAYGIGMVPHYGLYAKGADRVILTAHVSSLLVFAAVAALVARPAPFAAAAWGLLAAFLWMGGLKFVAYRRLGSDRHPDPRPAPAGPAPAILDDE
jgi:O-antigen/teichoic acid export membrane protein